MHIGGVSVVRAARLMAAQAWPEITKIPLSTTASQVAAFGTTATGGPTLPYAVLQVQHEQFEWDGGRAVGVRLGLTFHYLMRTTPGGISAETALDKAETLMGLLLDDVISGGKLGGLVERIEPHRVDCGDDNPVNMILMHSENNVSVTAASVTVEYSWSL